MGWRIKKLKIKEAIQKAKEEKKDKPYGKCKESSGFMGLNSCKGDLFITYPYTITADVYCTRCSYCRRLSTND